MSDLIVPDLAAWLAKAANLEYGQDIFFSAAPESVALATVIRETGGPGRRFQDELVFTCQVLTRGGDAQEVRRRAAALYNLIYPPPTRRPVRNVLLSDDWRALAIDAIQPPADIGVSEGGMQQMVFNIQVRAVPTGAA